MCIRDRYGEENGIEVHHYIISSGLKEIIEGSNIAQYFSRVYASSVSYTHLNAMSQKVYNTTLKMYNKLQAKTAARAWVSSLLH